MYRLCDEKGKVYGERALFRHMKSLFDSSGLEKGFIYSAYRKDPVLVADKDVTLQKWNELSRQLDDC